MFVINQKPITSLKVRKKKIKRGLYSKVVQHVWFGRATSPLLEEETVEQYMKDKFMDGLSGKMGQRNCGIICHEEILSILHNPRKGSYLEGKVIRYEMITLMESTCGHNCGPLST